MKQVQPLTIVGGRLVTPEGVRTGAIRCVGGLIDAIGDSGPDEGDEVIEVAEKLVAPGLIDFGVFAIDKPAFHFGGITRAALMPDQSPPLDHPARVRFAAQSGKPDLWVHPLDLRDVGAQQLQGRELAGAKQSRELPGGSENEVGHGVSECDNCDSRSYPIPWQNSISATPR